VRKKLIVVSSTSKVKCVNDGQAPCRGCLKSGISETCILSRPSKKTRVRSHRTAISANVPFDRAQTREDETQESRYTAVNEPRPANPPEMFDSDLAAPSSSLSTVQQHFEKYPSTIWTRATIMFKTHFPEYGYLHPDELERSSDAATDHHRLKLMALLAVTARYLRRELTEDMSEHQQFVATELQRRLTDPPSLALVQAYHLIGLWEWGEGHTYPAWIYVGIAIRMLQSLLAAKDHTHKVTEVESRTFWSCALLEKHVSNGRGRSVLLSLCNLSPPFPLSDDDFVWSHLSPSFRSLHVDTSRKRRLCAAA